MNASLYQGAQLEDWNVGWSLDPTLSLARCPYAGHNHAWHYAKAVTEIFLFHEILYIYIYIKEVVGGSKSNTEIHYNKEIISKNL